MFWYVMFKILLPLLFSGVYGQSEQPYNKTDCECVPFYLCVNGTIITNGEGIIDVRINENEECPGFLDICCNKKNIIESPSARNVPPVHKGCGYRKANGIVSRISGDVDNEALFGEFPWMIAVFYKGPNDQKHIYKCGGSLIHPQVVLSAAHCVVGSRSIKVRAGEWDSNTNQEIYRHQDKKVSSWIIHQNYNRRTLANDIALLFLDSPIDLAYHIDVVCLPPTHSVISSHECIVTGWGRDTFGKNESYGNILKKVELPTINHSQCQLDFQKTRLGKSFKLHKSFTCAGGEEGKDACSGDGGGPLVCPIPDEEDRYQQVGIVAWGIGCGTKGVPGAYVDVAFFRSWIDAQMKKNNFNSSFYQF